MPVEGTALLLPPRAVEFAQLPRLAMSEALPRSFLLRIAPLGALALSSKIDDVGHNITCPPGGTRIGYGQAAPLSACVVEESLAPSASRKTMAKFKSPKLS